MITRDAGGFSTKTFRYPAAPQSRISDQDIADCEALGIAIDSLRREVHRVYVEDADLAERALEAAAKDLGLTGVVEIKYFKAPRQPDLRGFVRPNEPRVIWVSAALKGPYLIRTVGHEAKHVHQLLNDYDR